MSMHTERSRVTFCDAGMLSGVSVRLFGLLVLTLAARAVAVGDVVKLEPHEALDLENKLPAEYANRTVTHAFQVSSNFLWFLISPRDFLPQVLLRIDKKSGASRLTEFAGQRFSPNWLQVDHLENVYLVRSGRQRDTIAVLGPEGTVRREIVFNDRALSYAIVRDGFVSASFDGSVRVHSSDGRVQHTLQTPNRAEVRLFSSPDGNIIGMDRRDGSGYSIGVKRDAFSPLQLASEEIEARRGLKNPQLLIVPTLDVDSEGAIWSLVSHIRLIEGALVVKSAVDGTHLRSYRCSLPQTERTIDTSGRMGANLIAIDGRSLYIASHRGTVARYFLPE